MPIFEDLPVYLYCDDEQCSAKHFITVNRDIAGKYIIGYVEFENHTAIVGLALNESDTFSEAVARMDAALQRRGKRVST